MTCSTLLFTKKYLHNLQVKQQKTKMLVFTCQLKIMMVPIYTTRGGR